MTGLVITVTVRCAGAIFGASQFSS